MHKHHVFTFFVFRVFQGPQGCKKRKNTVKGELWKVVVRKK